MSDKLKKLLLVTSNYWPENTGIGVYSTDLAENGLSPEYEITVLTGVPHYPWWKTPEEYSYIIPGIYKHNGVRILRVNHSIPKSPGAIGRATLEFSFWLNAHRGISNATHGEFDLVVAIMPTVAAGLVARSISKKLGVPYFAIFQDISSNGAMESGMTGAKWFAKISEFLEKMSIKGANGIVIVSPSMEKTLKKLTDDASSITLIPNYCIHDSIEIDKVSARLRLGLNKDAVIVLHTGNIGHKQDLLNLVAAGPFIQNSNIQILIVGHGNQENIVRKALMGIPNVNWRPSVSNEDYPFLLASADLLIVNERGTQLTMSLPSKITSYLATSRPILAAVPEGGATATFLEDVAIIVTPGNPKQLAEEIDKSAMNRELEVELIKKARALFDSKLSRATAYEDYKRWLNGGMVI